MIRREGNLRTFNLQRPTAMGQSRGHTKRGNYDEQHTERDENGAVHSARHRCASGLLYVLRSAAALTDVPPAP